GTMLKAGVILKTALGFLENKSVTALIVAAAVAPLSGPAWCQVTVHHSSAQNHIAPRLPGPRAFVTNTSANSLSVIDLDANTVTATISVGPSPTRVAVTPDGARALVTNFYGASVSVVDLGTSSVVATIPVGSYPAGVAISPTAPQAYVVRDYNGIASVIDLM